MKASSNLNNANAVSETVSPADGSALSSPSNAPASPLEDLKPQTCCSNCQTVFEVSLELLSSSDTRVRCGECLSIFDALANLREIPEHEGLLSTDVGNSITSSNDSLASDTGSFREASNLPDARAAGLAGLANDTSSLEVTYSDFDLFSTEANLPEVHYFDQTRDTPSFDFDELVEDEAEETFSDSLFAQDVTVDARSPIPKTNKASAASTALNASDETLDYIGDDIPQEPLVFNYRDADVPGTTETPVNEAESPYDPPPDPKVYSGHDRTRETTQKRTNNPWFMRSILVACLVVLSLSLYLYRERGTLQDNRLIRPLLEATCNVLSCELPPQVNLGALRAVDRSVVTHPTIRNALFIKFGMVNQAPFAQPYPQLDIRLTDRAGRLVVTNSFSPDEYLADWNDSDVLAVGERREIGLSVVDPGNSAMSFELDFRRRQ